MSLSVAFENRVWNGTNVRQKLGQAQMERLLHGRVDMSEAVIVSY